MADLPQNISLNGESLTLLPGRAYWLIDALYFDNIVEKGDKPDQQDIVVWARGAFEWNNFPFARFELAASDDLYELRVADIVDGDEDSAACQTQPLLHFDTDLSVLLVVAEEYVPTLIARQFSSDDLTYCEYWEQPYHDSFNSRYWQQVTADFAPHTAGVIMCPDADTFDFRGDGFYRLIIDNRAR